MTCRYDRPTKAHLTDDGERCTHDEHGNPVRHCRVRTRCTTHLGWDEHACPRCLGKIRQHLTRVVDLLALMPVEAIEQGRLDSEAAVLAGPHADYVTAQWALVNASRHGGEVDELDMRDPYTCLTLHERTIREDLGHDETTLVSPTVSQSASYLAWALSDLARHDDGATLLASLWSDCRRLVAHLDGAMRNGAQVDRGAPCPECVAAEAGVHRLKREYAPAAADDSHDRWVCPSDRDHWWWHGDYVKWIEERRTA